MAQVIVRGQKYENSFTASIGLYRCSASRCLMVSTLAMTDVLTKLMIAKDVITDEDFKAQLSAERANYLAVLKWLH